MKYVSPISHQLDVGGRAVLTLAVGDWTFEHVAELRLGAEVVGANKVHHAPVLHQIVLEWVTSKDHTPSAIKIIATLN